MTEPASIHDSQRDRAVNRTTLFATAFIACLAVTSAHAEQREPAPPPQEPSVATIRGDVVSSFFGIKSTRILMLDGRYFSGEIHSCDRYDLLPGVHSVAVAHEGHLVPLRIDAEAGDAFVIKWDQSQTEILYVENESTGEAGLRRSADRDMTIATYTEPDGTDAELASLKAIPKVVNEWPFGDQDEGKIYIAAIDGESPGDRIHTVRLTPAPHAVAFNLSFYLGPDSSGYPIYGWALIPVVLNAQSSASYALRYERPKLGFGQKTIGIWIENEVSGETVLPKVYAPVNIGRQFGGLKYREAPTFTDKKAKRPPPEPKLWCERDD